MSLHEGYAENVKKNHQHCGAQNTTERGQGHLILTESNFRIWKKEKINHLLHSYDASGNAVGTLYILSHGIPTCQIGYPHFTDKEIEIYKGK